MTTNSSPTRESITELEDLLRGTCARADLYETYADWLNHTSNIPSFGTQSVDRSATPKQVLEHRRKVIDTIDDIINKMARFGVSHLILSNPDQDGPETIATLIIGKHRINPAESLRYNSLRFVTALGDVSLGSVHSFAALPKEVQS